MQMYTVLSQEKTTFPYFQGVYYRDKLPPLQENMCAIVNSDDSSQPGTHCRKKKTQLSTSAENSTADPENIFLPPKENESAFQKAYKTFNIPNNDSSLGIKEFVLLRKEETIFIFRNELETYKALKVSKWVHFIYSKATDAGKMIKNVEFKTPNNEVLQETNLAKLYDDMSEKIVKESEDFEGRDSGWTLDEILRLEVRTNRYSPFRGSSSFIEVPKQIAETKAIINVINKKDSQCFMWSILAALYPNTSNPNKTSSYVPHLNKLNFDGISFPTPLNEVKKFSKMNDIGINIYSFEADLKIFPLLISDIVSVEKNNSTRHLNLKIKANAGEKQFNSSVGTKQLNSTGENNSTRQHERNNSTGENNSTRQQERTTQLGSRNETTQLVSSNETTQLCTAVDRLQPPAPPLQQNRLFLPTN
ncbi:c2H2-type domain-containing protein [Trichonephila clavipes]|uniref:C2H2-type domain-containing protein n=1 Tax=Trichonephila clavipes TaxID=2585209 RepID=A0A8X7BDM3_TRICX|nr:c2H2-type domain-containing protein [Trichonephila clavipes]